MTKPNNLLMLISIAGIVILLVGWLYLISNDKNPTEQPKNNTIQNNESSYVENTTKPAAEYNVKISGEKLIPNAKPQFEIGKKFEYETTTQMQGVSNTLRSVYSVDKIERINSTDYYVVVNSQTSQMQDPQTGAIMNITTETKSYINKENGEILKIVTSIGGQEITMGKDAASISGNGMFATWMLSLTDNFKWKVNAEDTSFGSAPSIETIEYQVNEKEKVNKRDCFKVEMKVKSKQMTGDEGKIIFWVDVEKRIVVKMQMYSGNLLVSDMNMVSGL